MKPFTEYRLKAHANGYNVIPIISQTKRPPFKGWQQKITNELEIEFWERMHPDCESTSLLTKNTPVLDLDILDKEACDHLGAMIAERYESSYVRIGCAPKRAFVFRTSQPFHKIVVLMTSPNGSEEKIEFLGDGQQCVFDGIHETTKLPYRCHGGDPTTVKRADLPNIEDEQAARELVEELVEELIKQFGYQRRGGSQQRKTGNGYDTSREAELIANIIAGSALHDSLRDLAFLYAQSGDLRADIIARLEGFMDGSRAKTEDHTRWKERFDEIDDLTDSAINKIVTPPDELPPDIVITDFYSYLPNAKYLYVPTQTLWPPKTINARLPKQGKKGAQRYLDRHRAVSQMIWAPGHPQIVKDKHLIEGGWYAKPGAIVFNQYRQPEIKGGDPRQAGPWLDLFKKLYPNPMEHQHIIKVLAYKLQHPATKINHAIVLAGGMRIGKDTLLLPFKRALGDWNCYEAKPATIMSAFNGYMRSILLTINETRDLGEVKRIDFYNHMKDVIASPPETVLVNEKHEKAVHVLNICLVIMTTNHRLDGIYLPPDDGRHFPVWSDVIKEQHDPEFFIEHYDWLNSGGDAHVAAYLRALDVSDFNPGRPPPLTDLFHEIVEQSTPLETYWIKD